MDTTATPAADPNPAPADALADVAGTHTVTDAERAAMAEDAQNDDRLLNDAEHASASDPKPTTTAAAAPTETETETATAAAASESAQPAQPPEAPGAPPPAASPPVPEVVAPPQPTGPVLLDVPVAPKDFDAEIKALEEKYSADEMDDAEYNRQYRTLTVEQARFEVSRSAIEAANAAAQKNWDTQQAGAFDQVASAWSDANKDFMSNPLRQKAMQDAINAVDTETGGKLPPKELLERAAKIAFDAYNWDPKRNQAPASPPAQPDPNAAARALAERDNAPTPPKTLSDAPVAGADAIDRRSDLDNLTVPEMEAAVASMSATEREAWLREVDSTID